MARLVIESGEDKGARFEIGASAVLGRLKSCEVPIKDRKSSRTNCRLVLEGGRYVLEDLGSSNGTFLNGEKVDRSPLKHGDRISIGNTVLRFETDAPAAPAPSSPAPAARALPPRPPTREVPAGPAAPRPLAPAAPPRPDPSATARRRPSAPVPAQAPTAGPEAPARPAPEPPAARPEPPARPSPPTPVPASPFARALLDSRSPSPEAPSPPVQLRPGAPAAPGPQDIAAMETPPAGIPSGLAAARPAPAPPTEEPEEGVEELDLGGGGGGVPVSPAPAPASSAAAPRPAPAPATPAPKKEFVPRVALRTEHASARGGFFIFQDLSQRSILYQALVWIVALGMMAGLAYGAFGLARSLF